MEEMEEPMLKTEIRKIVQEETANKASLQIEGGSSGTELKICPQEDCPFASPKKAVESNILVWIYDGKEWKRIGPITFPYHQK